MTRDFSLMDFDRMHMWELYSARIITEYMQTLDEGKDVQQYESLARAISALDATPIREELADVFYRAMADAPLRAGFPYEEPSDLPSIRAARPKDILSWQAPAKDDLLFRRLRGAWLGRVCGCLLGKPVEGWKSPDIDRLLRASDNFPLRRYMSLDDVKKAGMENHTFPEACWIDLVNGFAPSDDDTNYTATGAQIIERYGRSFTPNDVAEAWMRLLNRNCVCTAERVAFCNFIMGIRPPKSASYKNPYREYIGAQIRGDYFGYINPGNPELAAEMAWRDASISHIKNGIYGEMFIAAMLAVAAVCSDVKTVILEGLKQIPEKSRLTAGVLKIVRWYEEGVSQADCFARIHEEWNENDDYHWCHTISNAMIVAAALLYGEMDYSRSVCMAVETGFDTDCNGATVGSVLGLMLTDEGIPACWTDPVHGRLCTSIVGMEYVSLDEMAEMTMKHCLA